MAGKHLFATKLGESSTDQKEEMGAVRFEIDRARDQGLKKYRYVKYHGGTAAVNGLEGDVVCYVGTTPFATTKDVSDTSIYRVAGILATASTTGGRYCWIQIGGFCHRILTDGNAAAGTPLVATTTDGIVGSMAVGYTGNQLGIALAADSGTVLASAILQLAS